MIVDTSAIVAVSFRDPGFEDVLAKLAAAERAGAGAPTPSETAIVLTARLGRDARGLLERFLQEFAIETVPFGDEHWRAAHDAYRRFGKGRHRARLDFGVCLSYATGALTHEPSLYVGEDFSKTDLELA